MIKNCLVCKNEFNAKNNDVKRGMGKYCSRKCYIIGVSTGKSFIIKKCLNCKKGFKAYKSKSIYCSKKCSNSGTKKNRHWSWSYGKKRVVKKCLLCGNEFEALSCYIKRGQYKYCSIGCKSKGNKGKNNYNWRGGSSFYPYPIYWDKTLRTSVRKRDNFVCRICGKNGFVVHHIDYNKENCSQDNLVTLCRHCHAKTNTNRNYWKNYFNPCLH